MVHGNAIFVREEAKLAKNNHRYTFSTLTSWSIKQTTSLAARNYLLT